jgi:hypothetical protein
MGPFSSTHFILKTGISAGSRPTTSRNVRVPFSLLSQSLQCFRAAGFGVEAINVDPTAPQVTRTSPEAISATKAAPRKKAEPTPTAKKEAAPTRAPKSGGRRGRRKAS